jgi:nucleotide-binding universal stress UspA family protein
MYFSVLVPLDGSRAAAEAVPPALELARAFAARLVFLRVIPTENGTDGPTKREYDAQRNQAEGYLESLERSLRTSGVGIDRIVEEGDPASDILALARSLPRPLLVITAFGRTQPASQGDLGTVAQEVLRKAESPVVLIRPPFTEATSSVRGGMANG